MSGLLICVARISTRTLSDERPWSLEVRQFGDDLVCGTACSSAELQVLRDTIRKVRTKKMRDCSFAGADNDGVYFYVFGPEYKHGPSISVRRTDSSVELSVQCSDQDLVSLCEQIDALIGGAHKQAVSP